MVARGREEDDKSDVSRFQVEKRRRVLRGLDGVFVLIESLSPALVSDGLWPNEVREVVHTELLERGVPVVTFEQACETNSPWLYVNVHGLKVDAWDAYAVSVEVSVRDNVWLDRDELRLAGPMSATTWMEQTLLWTPLSELQQTVCRAVESLVRRFADDYVEAHRGEG